MIGLLPCAGNATRIHGLPKFLLPIPGGYLLQRHISGMRAVGCDPILIGGNPDNLELLYDHALAKDVWVYLAQQRETMTQTVLSSGYTAETILFSMPDTFMPGPAVYLPLQMALENGADVAVALFEARPGQHTQGGMCRVEGNQVAGVIDKPSRRWSGYDHIWGALAWQPAFWECLDPADPHVGYGLPRAIDAGMDVRAVVCEGGYWDCGTPERYFECIRSEIEHDRSHGCIQWKGTEVCMDIHCICGESTHIDAAFLYYVKCGACGRVYECDGHIQLHLLEFEPDNTKVSA